MSDSEIDRLARKAEAIALQLMRRIDATHEKVERSRHIAAQSDLVSTSPNVVMIDRAKIVR
jgi:hypothetical protein